MILKYSPTTLIPYRVGTICRITMMEDGESAVNYSYPSKIYVGYWKREGMELFELKMNKWIPHRWNPNKPFFEEYGGEDDSGWIDVEIV